MSKRSLKYILIVTLLITLLVAPFVNVRVRAQDTGPGGSPGESPPQTDVANLSQPVPGASRVAYHAQTGLVSFIGTQAGQAIPQPSPLPQGASPEAAALNFLAAYGEVFGLNDPSSALSADGRRDGRQWALIRALSTVLSGRAGDRRRADRADGCQAGCLIGQWRSPSPG